jgi:hypothetical protein
MSKVGFWGQKLSKNVSFEKIDFDPKKTPLDARKVSLPKRIKMA